MDSERLKRNSLGCLALVFCFFVLLGFENWFGSGPAIRELKQYISSVDSKQFRNASYNDSRIETLEREAGLIPEKWTIEKCSSAQVKGA